MGYNFTAQWVKGTQNNAPGAPSRHPVSDPESRDLHGECDPNNEVGATIAEIRAISGEQESILLQELRALVCVTNNCVTISWMVYLITAVSFQMSVDITGASMISCQWMMG